jgi:hypothetical protein
VGEGPQANTVALGKRLPLAQTLALDSAPLSPRRRGVGGHALDHDGVLDISEDCPGREKPGDGGWAGVPTQQSGHSWPILRYSGHLWPRACPQELVKQHYGRECRTVRAAPSLGHQWPEGGHAALNGAPRRVRRGRTGRRFSPLPPIPGLERPRRRPSPAFMRFYQLRGTPSRPSMAAGQTCAINGRRAAVRRAGLPQQPWWLSRPLRSLLRPFKAESSPGKT